MKFCATRPSVLVLKETTGSDFGWIDESGILLKTHVPRLIVAMTHFWEKMAELGPCAALRIVTILSFLLPFFFCRNKLLLWIVFVYDKRDAPPFQFFSHHQDFPYTLTCHYCLELCLSGWPWLYCSRWTFCALIGNLEGNVTQEKNGGTVIRIEMVQEIVQENLGGVVGIQCFVTGVWANLSSLFVSMNVDDLLFWQHSRLSIAKWCLLQGEYSMSWKQSRVLHHLMQTAGLSLHTPVNHERNDSSNTSVIMMTWAILMWTADLVQTIAYCSGGRNTIQNHDLKVRNWWCHWIWFSLPELLPTVSVFLFAESLKGKTYINKQHVIFPKVLNT